jgi:heme exporter protein A
MNAATHALEASGVSKTFGHFPALAGVDLAVSPGRAVTLFGPNGAGKTTFLKIAATLSRATSGQIRIGGFDLTEQPERARRALGFLSHNTCVYRDLTPMENLRFFARLDAMAPSDEALLERLEQVGLGHRAHDPVRSFSRGQLQRVGIARVMLHDPSLLLLDEPYTGLDANAVGILNRLLDEAVGRGATVLLTTHDLELGLRAASQVHIIHRGRIVYTGLPGDAETREAYRRYIEAGGRK